MRVIFVKHLNNDKEFLFSIPDHICDIKIQKGDLVIVQTYRGLAMAIVTSEIEYISENVAKRLGAYLPLKNVIAKVDTDFLKFIDDVKYQARKREEETAFKEQIPF